MSKHENQTTEVRVPLRVKGRCGHWLQIAVRVGVSYAEIDGMARIAAGNRCTDCVEANREGRR